MNVLSYFSTLLSFFSRCSYNVIYGDSLEDKSVVFNNDLNLKVNVLKGKSSLGSSGKFLKNKISSKKQLQVSLTAEFIMFYEELEMNQLQTLISNADTNATHIVTAIEYGANGTFTFERTISNNEDGIEARGELEGKIASIPGFHASAKGELGMKNIDKQTAENISCKFCGDIILPVNPTTYEEAIQVYKQLSSYIKEDEAVPVTVWLYPIPKGETHAKVLQEINKEKVKLAVIAFDDLQRIYVSCHDLMSSQALVIIPELQCKVDQFRRIVQEYQEDFQNQVFDELLKEDDPTKDIMSPWLIKIGNMRHWLSQNVEIEMSLLNIYINEIKKADIEILLTVGLEAKLFEHDLVIILDIVLPFSDGQYVKKESDTRSNYATQRQQTHVKQTVSRIQEHIGQSSELTPSSNYAKEKNWFTDSRIKALFRKTIKRFITLNARKTSSHEFFVTFTDSKYVVPHNDKPSYVRVVSYENGEESTEIDVFSAETDEMLHCE